MDIRQLLTFKKVVETGGITRAGNELGYAQPTVTLHIHELEKELQVQLFDRIGRKLHLTDAGQELYDCTRDLAQVIDRIESIGNETEQLNGSIRIAVPPAIVNYRICSIFEKFLKAAPHVDIYAINYHSSKKIYELLYSGDVDFAILSGAWQSSDDLTVHLLERADHVLIASPGLDTSVVNLTNDNQPLGTRLILNQNSSTSHSEIENYLRQHNITPNGTIEVWGIEAIKQCVALNLGISFLPRIVIEKELREKQLVELPTDHEFIKYTLNLAYLNRKWNSAAFKLFRTMLLESFEERLK